MDCIYIAPLSKALYNFLPLIHPFTHTFTHQRRLAAMQGTNQLVRSNWGLGVLAQGHFDTPRVGSNRQPSDCQTTALPPEPHRPTSCVILAVCFRSLSLFGRLNFGPVLRSWALSKDISVLCSVQLSINPEQPPSPSCWKHPHSMMLPPPCFTPTAWCCHHHASPPQHDAATTMLHPHSMMLPPPCFTAGMVLGRWWAVPGFLQRWRLELKPNS